MKKVLIGILLSVLIGGSAIAQKKSIKSTDQLPRRTVALSGKVADIFNNDILLTQLAEQLYQNLQQDLDEFDIQDKSTLSNYESSLAQFEFWLGKYDRIPARLERVRELEEREEDKLIIGLTFYAQLEALQKHPINSKEYLEVVKIHYTQALNKLPYSKIEDYVNSSINRYMMMNPEVLLPTLETQLQPYIDNGKGHVLEQIASAIVINKSIYKYNFILKETLLSVLQEYKAAHTAGVTKAAKANIWAERDVNLQAKAGQPVVVAIWDTGVDTSLFPDQLWKNSKEKLNGKDNDNNGYTDDINGIAFDYEHRRTSGSLIPAQKLQHSKEQLLAWTKGSMDLQHGVASAEAQAFQQKVSTLKPEEAQAFQEDLGWFGVYAHGTHVAGIAVKGNPLARILYTRLSYETISLPTAPTEERHQNALKMYTDMVYYWQKAGVRVVNISLRFSPSMFEGMLNLHGIGADQEDRKATALRWFNAEKKALENAMRSAPEILFICAAGNEANDADFANYYPASLVLPNLLTIGAVDSEGKTTSFTTKGKNITLFANGYEVESYVPGGAKVNFNGTSMAAPQVANLAAKILVVNPQLKPEQIKQLLFDTSTVSEENNQIRLIHPRNAIEAAVKTRKDYKPSLLDQLIAKAK